jgi:aminoglycoside/choline kinase family phosphotransferase
VAAAPIGGYNRTVTNASCLSEPQQWIADALARRWPGARAARIVALRGDASTRRFWRVFVESSDATAPRTSVAVDLGPDDLPLYARALNLLPEPLSEPPWVNVHRFLASIGVAVPELYFAPPGTRLLLVEDVGDVALFEAAKQKPSRTAELYRLALDELMLFHAKGTQRPDPRCIAFRVAYDERLFAWEMEQFVECGMAAAAPDADPAAIRPELRELAARLGRLPRVLSHRDYHGQNLFVQNGAVIRVLDFQDALMAPAAQDLAVLLTTRDTATIITPALESDLLSYYLDRMRRCGADMLEPAEFLESYRLCVLQHALKAIGRFTWLERTGKSGYLAYLPHCLEQARRMLAERSDFPRLRAALVA